MGKAVNGLPSSEGTRENTAASQRVAANASPPCPHRPAVSLIKSLRPLGAG